MENAKPEASVPGEPKLNGFNQQEISEDDIYTDDLFDIEQFAANEGFAVFLHFSYNFEA